MPRYEDDDTQDYDDYPRRPRDERGRGEERPRTERAGDQRRDLAEERRRDLAEQRRRDSLIERRLRAARGEAYDDNFSDDYQDRRAYPRAGEYAPRYAPEYRQPTSGAATILYLFLGIIAVGALLLMLAPSLMGSVLPRVDVPAAIQQVVASPTPTLVDRGGTILQIRNLSRLETHQFSAERVIEAKVERGNPLDLLLGDRLLLIASGTVITGVDMSKVGDQDVTISPDGTNITINLPPSEIFIRTLDNERTRVYDRQTGIFANQDQDLETQARQEAETQILATACEAGVMQQAADSATNALTQVMKAAGFETVTVNGRAGECIAAPTVPVDAPAGTTP